MATLTLLGVKIEVVIDELICEALKRLRLKETAGTTDDGDCYLAGRAGEPPGPLDQERLDVILRAVGTHRPISWQHAWSLLHHIVDLQARILEVEERQAAEEQDETEETVAGAYKTRCKIAPGAPPGDG